MTRDKAFDALLKSDRVSARTRNALLDRGKTDDQAAPPNLLMLLQMATLRAVTDRILPQTGAHRIDLAARVVATLAEGAGDGWRFAALPADVDAYRAALDTLDNAARSAFGCAFGNAETDQQDDLLRQASKGECAADNATFLSVAQMQLWFEDVRSDAVKAYMSHPAITARIGHSAFANGGDGPRPQGFDRVGEGEREDWEPPAAEAPR